MKLKQLVLFTALCGISLNVFSQLEDKIKSENVIEGVIIKEGKEIQGYIKQMICI